MNAPQMRRSRLTVSGIEIDLLEAGAGRPLLFLHAGETPTVYGDAYIAQLAKSHRVILPTHPGFGGSARPDGFRSVDDLAYFYLDLARDLDLRDAVLVGASFGGWIAAEVAVRSTARFSALVLCGALGIKVGGREDRDIFDLHAIPTVDWPSHYFLNAAFRPDFSKWPAAERLGVTRAREALTLYGWKPYMHNPILRRWLHRIDIPSLIVWGDQDRIVGLPYGRAYHNDIHGSRFDIVGNAGHFAHIDQPEIFARTIDQFLSDAGHLAQPPHRARATESMT